MNGPDVIRQFLDALRAHDWPKFADAISDERFVRVGPYIDTLESKDEYVEFLREIMPQIPGYEMELERISAIGPDRYLVEMAENVVVDGVPTPGPQANIFELDGTGKICGVSIFKKSPAAKPTLPGIDVRHRGAGADATA
ncbi:hypothetical protein GCM10009836_01800 [Pseudonocardia ailaonensis]|uniref:SnoaL-like domain-containing protein n=1 Tax=Pseudonocardia ailaonensis TaxID=367279 RepID=A0ABN2MI05_9PSEU